MQFRTAIDIPEYGFRLGHDQQGLMMGSCFAVSVGKRMTAMKMPVTVNPFGIIYNPASLIRILDLLEQGTPDTEDDLREDNGLWIAFSHHSAFSSPDKAETLVRINESVRTGHRSLTDADYLI